MTRPSFLASVSKKRWRSAGVRFNGGAVISAALADNAQAKNTNNSKRTIPGKYFRHVAAIRRGINVSPQFFFENWGGVLAWRFPSPSFPHALSGNPGRFGLGPRLKRSGVTSWNDVTGESPRSLRLV